MFDNASVFWDCTTITVTTLTIIVPITQWHHLFIVFKQKGVKSPSFCAIFFFGWTNLFLKVVKQRLLTKKDKKQCYNCVLNITFQISNVFCISRGFFFPRCPTNADEYRSVGGTRSARERTRTVLACHATLESWFMCHHYVLLPSVKSCGLLD